MRPFQRTPDDGPVARHSPVVISECPMITLTPSDVNLLAGPARCRECPPRPSRGYFLRLARMASSRVFASGTFFWKSLSVLQE